ncbi:MAG: amino acid adenylation domain-containing protein [Thermodesulfobacteriota bacterium]
MNFEIIPRNGERDLFPLSFGQERLWFLHQLNPGGLSYNETGVFQLVGPLNIKALEDALNEIIRRHDILRTTFITIDGKPFQNIAHSMTLNLPVVDISNLPASTRRTAALRIVDEEVDRTFDLAKGPLTRYQLVHLGDEENWLIVSLHHIVCDGLSIGLFFREAVNLYAAFSKGEPSPLLELPIQYADYALWQREMMEGENLKKQLSYWERQLSAPLRVLELPTDNSRLLALNYKRGNYRFELPVNLYKDLRELKYREKVTLFMTLLAALNVLLFRYTGLDDIIVQSPISGRTHSKIRRLIGFFVNALVLRTDLTGNPSFRELLGRVKKVCLEAYDHQELPYERLVREINPDREPTRSPLGRVVLVLLKDVLEPAENSNGVRITPIRTESGTDEIDLTLFIWEGKAGLTGNVIYNANLFSESTITLMIERFQILLEGIVEHPEQRITDLPILTEREKHQLLVEWNDTKREYPRAKCIHELFEEQVERAPESIAVVFEDQELTYRELNQRANKLARHLQSLGVAPETSVGLFMDRSPEIIVGLLGILKAGGTYVPIDASYPEERLSFILEVTKLPIVLTQNSLESKFRGHKTRSKTTSIKHIFSIDSDQGITSNMPKKNPTSNVSHDSLALLFFTSGSTGKPKGIELEHSGICNFTEEMTKNLEIAPNDRILQFTSTSFIVSIIEIFAALSSGATLVMGSQKSLMPGIALTRFLFDNAISVATLPPSTISSLYETDLPKLRILIATGESVTSDIVKRWSSTKKFLNLYGTTETGIATLGELNGQTRNTPLIGRPISNMQVYLLDDKLNPVPVGVRGEICIAGTGLARGYLNRPDLTSEKFIPNPFDSNPGSRIYRSGDFARYRTDGSLEFLGRFDNQVKIRGFRVELREIEATMLSNPDVREAVAIAQEHELEGKRILVYFSPAQDRKIIVSEIREFLKENLPYFMIPSQIILLSKLPRSPNGKIDPGKLPLPNKSRPELREAYVAPSSVPEELLERIFASILGIENVGVNDTFFDLGGHSLKATQVISRIKDTFKIDLPQSAIYDMPTITRLAKLIGTYDIKENRPSLPPITPASKIRKVSKISENKFPHVDGQTDE